MWVSEIKSDHNGKRLQPDLLEALVTGKLYSYWGKHKSGVIVYVIHFDNSICFVRGFVYLLPVYQYWIKGKSRAEVQARKRKWKLIKRQTKCIHSKRRKFKAKLKLALELK